MRRTILEWYNLVVNDDLRELLLENLREENVNTPVRNIADAINAGFNWQVSRERHDFWASIQRNSDGIELREEPIAVGQLENDDNGF